MSTTPTVLTPVVMNPELEAAIKQATDPQVIRQLVIDEAKKQAGAVQEAADKAAAEVKKAEDDAAAAAAHAAEIKEYTRTVNIGGTEFEFTASSELALERQVNQAYQVAYAIKPEAPIAPAVDPAIAAAAAVKAEEQKALARVELETKFKRGDISAKDYIRQSGAMDEFLAEQGLSVATLKETVEQAQSAKYEQSWQQAVDAFKQSPAGRDWPGGEQNLNIIGLQIAALGLQDAPDKVGALAQAYAKMKELKTVFPTQAEETPDQRAANATARAAAAAEVARIAADTAAGASVTPGEAAAAAILAKQRAAAAATVQTTAPTSSSLFGRSSGVGGNTDVQKKVEPVVEIPKDATPQEIMDAWKTAQRQAGLDPNAAFQEQFRVNKR